MKKLSALILCLTLAANIIVGMVVAAPNESSAEAEKLLTEFFKDNKHELAYDPYYNESEIDYAFLADIDNDGNPELLLGLTSHDCLTVYKVIDGNVTKMSDYTQYIYFKLSRGMMMHLQGSLLMDDDGHMYLYTTYFSQGPGDNCLGAFESQEISEWNENGEKTLKYKGFSYKLNYDGTYLDETYYSTDAYAPNIENSYAEFEDYTVKISLSEAKTIYDEFENLINPYIVWTEESEYKNELSTDIWEKQKELYEKNSTDFDERRIILQIGNSFMDVDGETKPIDAEYNVAPIIKDERTLVPVRAIVEEIGGSVEWDAENCAATLSYGETEIKLVIGENTAYLNGIPHVLDVAPIIENGRTMFPIRFIAENFGLDVKWKKLTNQIIVSGYDNHGNL